MKEEPPIEKERTSAEESVMEESSVLSVEEKPVSGGELRMAAYMPQTLNPLETTRPETAQLLMMVFMPLLETDTQGVPTDQGLVRQWQVSLDGYQVKLRLRDGLLWQDGTRIDVNDVIFSLNALAWSESDNYWKAQLGTFAGAQEGNSGEVIVSFSSPVDENRLSMLVVPILPEHIYNVDDAPRWLPVGSGPYQVSDYQPMREIRLMANPEYAGHKPYIPEIVVDITRSEDAAQSAFEHGLTQILYEERPTGLSAENIYHHAVYQTDTYRLQLLHMNQEEGALLADPVMRQAIMYCIDAGEFIDRTQLHQGTPSESVVPNWLADNGLEEEYGVDYQKAYSLLGENKMAELRLIVSREAETDIAQAELIYKQLAEIGLRVKITLLDPEEWQEAMEAGEYDLALGSCSIRSAQDLYELLASDGEANYSRREDPRMDEYLEKIAASSGQEERAEAYAALAAYAWETLPVCPLYYSKQGIIVSRQLGGELEPSVYHIYKGVENLYYHVEKQEEAGS